MKKINKLVLDFLEYQENLKGRSSRTVRNYDLYLQRFVGWLNKKKIEDVGKITQTCVSKYEEWLKQYEHSVRKEKLKASTVNYHLIAVRSFLRYLSMNNVSALESHLVKLNKLSVAKATVLDKAELQKLMNAPVECECDWLLCARDNAILQLLTFAGLTVSQISALLKSDLCSENAELKIKKKKFGHKKIRLNNQMTHCLKKYLNKRNDDSKYLFIGHDRARSSGKKIKGLSPRSIERIVTKYAKKINLKKKVTPHVLRHSFAANLLEKGMDLDQLSMELGHSSVHVTKKYTNQLG